MAVAFVQSTGIQTGSNVATDSASFASLPAVGNHVFTGISCWRSGGAGIDAVTDNQSNTYTRDAQVILSNNSSSHFGGKVATSSGTFTVTVDPTGASANYLAWASVEFSGLDTTTWLDRTGTNSSTTGDANVTASAANTTNDGVALACMSQVNGGDTDINVGDTPPTGYTNIAVYEDGANIVALSYVYKIYSASETSAATWTHDNDFQNRWTAAIATYKMASAGGGGATSPGWNGWF